LALEERASHSLPVRERAPAVYNQPGFLNNVDCVESFSPENDLRKRLEKEQKRHRRLLRETRG
jgi:hypothetical protein